jgi:hypothetical protein
MKVNHPREKRGGKAARGVLLFPSFPKKTSFPKDFATKASFSEIFPALACPGTKTFDPCVFLNYHKDNTKDTKNGTLTIDSPNPRPKTGTRQEGGFAK